MKAMLGKAPAYLIDATGVTEILICPAHPKNWIEEYLANGEHPDTSQFCNCCTDDCSPFCRSCDNAEVGA